ncbi:molecular chaperone DnaJ [Mycoplasma simbae]|uniref:molecular chaperone DnaJ n=1 Tax=Mycoplasma simbae TaxID=36744 RepID=UPI000496108F|nr:molecular chaperone DnaJ [Mycoplasma simbae]
MSKKDYYEILGVSRDATEKEIKTAYRKLAMQYHPDKLKDGTSDQKMQELNQAYEVLSDKQKRANYDQYGSEEGPQGFGGQDFGGFGGFDDIIHNFFGGFGGFKSKNTGPTRGSDLLMNLKISFEDSIKGKEITQRLQKWESCSSCHGRGAASESDIKTCSGCGGTGQKQVRQRSIFGVVNSTTICNECQGKGQIITNKCKECKGNATVRKDKNVTFKISEGAQTGDRIKITGYGASGENGGPAGDLYIELEVEQHKHFKREGLNLFMDYPVSFIDIIRENEVLVPTPFGNETIKLRRNYQNGKTLVLKGRGVRRSGRAGDLKIQLQVVIPDLSTSEFEKISKQLSDVKDTTNIDFVKQFK